MSRIALAVLLASAVFMASAPATDVFANPNDPNKNVGGGPGGSGPGDKHGGGGGGQKGQPGPEGNSGP